ncbi:hypothetical protein EAX61_06610 [Dokdonia sinensis]|uniref:Uncharacterized protein n=1 Tax=Dokdonia sinensis TaxID=2479847 RepID=A0A3M0G7N1_9FLAO|nr:hypothetical protein [Dokdonia sinensis]RMB60488.1 hypothetical protein EAX61_06610 [Dokdonia sinensis]
MGKDLFKNVKPRHSLQVDRSGKAVKVQDIPKQDFLFCSVCEKRIEILETYFARKLIAINDYRNRKEKFEEIEIGPNKILVCLDLNPLMFKLFYFSMIWRLSITANSIFKNFKLPKKIELEIGSFLDVNLKPTHKELLKNLSVIQSFPSYHLMAYKRKDGPKKFAGILTAFQMSKDHFGVFTSDIILFFHLNENKIDTISRLISNKENKLVKFILADSEQWRNVSLSIVQHRLLNNSS